MAHIVIIGAGIGGMTAAYEMREELNVSDHKITVVGDKPEFEFTPSNPWVAVGWRKRHETALDIGPYLNRKKIDFVASPVTKIDAANNKVSMANGTTLDYDYLVITTGPKLAFHEIPGFGPDEGYTNSVCTLSHAERSYEDYRKLVADPGPAVVGAAQMASCFGPAYEYAFILETALRKERVRDKVPITYITSEPYIGHLGLGGVGDSKGMLESELRNRHIKWITNAKIDDVAPAEMTVSECDDDGKPRKEHKLPFRFAMILPAFKGVDAVANVPELCNPRGFVLIDEHQRSKRYPNIFSAGVCVAIPPVEATPVATGAPKTGYMIESMVSAICENITADIQGKPATASGTWNAICIADFGDTGAAFVA
ncbi:MAG: FAD-dependent oxidoreductase, partial [Gammaproteobacteria bacterium]|nr:FAD-dependent oxidoreductase [Gammaproteobacteria bacterium]